MKSDKECEDHKCKALPYCKWHPDVCQGKPWDSNKHLWERILLRPTCFGDTIHCPYKFTEKMYNCPHFETCEKKTEEEFYKFITRRYYGGK